MKLFTFPYAFGTDAAYNELTSKLASHFNVENINYPGHGKRIQENFLFSIEELAQDAIEIIKKSNEDYALLGYSLGARVCCEIMRQLQETSYRKPKHVFLLASEPPSIKPDLTQNSNMTIEEAKDLLYEMGNTPKEIIESEEIMAFIHPMMQADTKVLENSYRAKWPYEQLDIPLTVINGHDDEDLLEAEKAWQTFFPVDTDLERLRFDGGHFFLFENEENLVKLKNIILDKLVK